MPGRANSAVSSALREYRKDRTPALCRVAGAAPRIVYSQRVLPHTTLVSWTRQVKHAGLPQKPQAVIFLALVLGADPPLGVPTSVPAA